MAAAATPLQQTSLICVSEWSLLMPLIAISTFSLLPSAFSLFAVWHTLTFTHTFGKNYLKWKHMANKWEKRRRGLRIVSLMFAFCCCWYCCCCYRVTKDNWKRHSQKVSSKGSNWDWHLKGRQIRWQLPTFAFIIIIIIIIIISCSIEQLFLVAVNCGYF